MKGKYKTSSSYCDRCDKDYVQSGKKCNYCGYRMPGSKIRKKTTNQYLNELYNHK